MNLDDLQIEPKRLTDICLRYRVAKLEVFGSFVAGEAGEASDVDVLVTLEPDAGGGFEFIKLHRELEQALSRRVDLLTRQSVEQSPNKYFRRFALDQTVVVYEHAA